MGKNLRQQRRGKGTPRYKSPSHRYIGRIRHSGFGKEGSVVDIVHGPGFMAPVAIIDTGDGKMMNIATEGMHVGQKIMSDASEGSISQLQSIPEGTKICNVELVPGDGGKLCRTSGAFATVVSHDAGKTIIELPSGHKKTLISLCRAVVGVPAGAGRNEKPFRKAGNHFYAMTARNRMWPRTRGVAMNPLDHPFGGKTKPGKPKTVSRHMPPGKKVGSISARRTGKRK